MAGVANFLTTRRSSLLPHLSRKKQKYWYKLLVDMDLTSAGGISPEFVDFVGKNPDVVALASMAFAASEVMFFRLIGIKYPSGYIMAQSWPGNHSEDIRSESRPGPQGPDSFAVIVVAIPLQQRGHPLC